MKVAISSQGPCLSDPVDTVFGRCRYLLIVEGDRLIEARENQGAAQESGAGVRLAQEVVRSGAKALLGAEPGPKAMNILRPSGVDIYIAKQMRVDQALAAFKEGKLPKVDEAEAVCAEDTVLHGKGRAR